MSPEFDLLTRLVDDLPGMAYRCRHDADWTLEFVSAGCEGLLGYTPRELVEDRVVAVSDLVHPEDLAGVSLEVERAISQREPFSLVYRMRTREGQIKHIAEQGRGLFGPDGELEALEGFLSDVSGQVQAQDALRQAEKREVVGRLAGGLAHDLNNLLTTIYGATAMLMTGIPVDSELREEVEVLESVAEQAARVTRQLLMLGRPAPALTAPTDLALVLREQLTLLRRMAGDGIDLRVSCPEGPLGANLEPSSFGQVLLNLVLNARDAQEGAGPIDVRLGTEDGRAVLEVQDIGSGLRPGTEARIFDPFFSTKRGKGGTGLGLTVVQDVVEAAQGTVTVDSTPGAGATFRVTIPLSARDVPASEQGLPLGSEVLLLAEDNPGVREALARGLRRLGYTVLVAADGQEALKLSARHKGSIEALITDANMPHVNGVDLARGFGAQRPTSARLLISGDHLTIPADLFDRCLRKPLTPEDLAGSLREVLDQSERPGT
jgi:PAS domain S-box-containing protein